MRSKIETFTYVKGETILGYGCTVFDGTSKKVLMPTDSDEPYFESEKIAKEAGVNYLKK